MPFGRAGSPVKKAELIAAVRFMIPPLVARCAMVLINIDLAAHSPLMIDSVCSMIIGE